MSNKKFFTNFGFKKVDIEDKKDLVKGVFDGVASKYDVMNDLMSFGIHRLWKYELIKMINPESTQRLLDVGGGTADIGLLFLKKGGSEVKAVDINSNMLEEGKRKALNQGYVSSIDFICADAEKLPFEDNSFPAYNTAFCIRNVTNIDVALKEAYRVIQPGGKFFCLEFSKVDHKILKEVYKQWSFKAIPKIGKAITNNEEAYQYLVESIEKFPKQEDFAEMIKQAGFKNVKYKNLTFGVVAIHSAEK